MGDVVYYNYGRIFPDRSDMMIVAEVDGELAGHYRGVYDGIVVRCKLIKRFIPCAPNYACLAPEAFVGRINHPIAPEHMR
jgi:hypothetical protein